MMVIKQPAPWVLVFEDDDDDFLLLKRAFEESGNPVHLTRALDGEGLMPQLLGSVSDGGPAYPKFILMDLRMPRKDGREALRDLKNHSDLKKIPVLVLTTSKYHGDVNRSYLEGANSYFTKPNDFRSLVSMIGTICDYWLKNALHPAPEPAGSAREKEKGQ